MNEQIYNNVQNQVTTNSQVVTKEPKNNKGYIVVIILLIAVILGLVAYILLGDKKENNNNTTTTTTTTKKVDNEVLTNVIGEDVFSFENTNTKLKVLYKYEEMEPEEGDYDMWEYTIYAELYLNDKLVSEKKHYVDFLDEIPEDYTEVEDAYIITKDDVKLIKTDKEYVLVYIYTASETSVPGRELVVVSETGKTVENIDLTITEYEFSDETISNKYNGNKYYYENDKLHYVLPTDEQVKEIVCEIKNDKVTQIETNYLDISGIMNAE